MARLQVISNIFMWLLNCHVSCSRPQTGFYPALSLLATSTFLKLHTLQEFSFLFSVVLKARAQPQDLLSLQLHILRCSLEALFERYLTGSDLTPKGPRGHPVSSMGVLDVAFLTHFMIIL